MRSNIVKPCMICVVYFVILSCNSSKNITISKNSIDGTWIVKNITIEGLGGKVDVKAFDEANYLCFNGSTWKFKDEDKTGEFSLNGGGMADCPDISRQINWKVVSSDTAVNKLEFKKITDGSSYTMSIIEINDQTMQLKYEIANITFMGKPIAMVYDFIRS